MSPPGQRALGRVVGALVAAGQAIARHGTDTWAALRRRADVCVPAAFFAAGAGALMSTYETPTPSTVIGLPPLAFILLVMIRARRANWARRHEAAGEIDGARYTVHQCVAYLGLLASLSHDGRRVRPALDRLSLGIRLVITRHRKYLDEKAVEAAIGAERIVLDAELGMDAGPGDYVPALSRQLGIMSGGILGIDDPRVSYGLGRI